MAKLDALLELFIKKYVQCHACGNPETRIKIRKGSIHLMCKVRDFDAVPAAVISQATFGMFPAGHQALPSHARTACTAPSHDVLAIHLLPHPDCRSCRLRRMVDQTGSPRRAAAKMISDSYAGLRQQE